MDTVPANLMTVPAYFCRNGENVTFHFFIQQTFFFNLAVCRALVDEVNHSISLVDSKQKVQVGSFRVDSKGNQKVVEVCLMHVELIHG